MRFEIDEWCMTAVALPGLTVGQTACQPAGQPSSQPSDAAGDCGGSGDGGCWSDDNWNLNGYNVMMDEGLGGRHRESSALALIFLTLSAYSKYVLVVYK